MACRRSSTNVNDSDTHFVQIGADVYPIYGDERSGWSINEDDLDPRNGGSFRYKSLDELVFALVNFQIGGAEEV